MEDHHHHHHHHLTRPLLNPSTAAIPPLDNHVLHNTSLVSSNSGIILRLSFIAFIGIVSVWANHEASKGYDIIIVTEPRGTLAANRFRMFYESNDEAARLIIKASKVIENFLYPSSDNPTKKQVRRVVLQLAKENLTDNVVVVYPGSGEFVLNVSPSIMEGTNFRHAMVRSIYEGVARVWLWDGQGNAPINLINGIVEYTTHNLLVGSFTAAISSLVGAEPPRSTTACWKRDDSRVVAEFLNYCERRRPGFIRRLNEEMMDGWDDGKLDGALGLSVGNVCTTYESLRYNISSV